MWPDGTRRGKNVYAKPREKYEEKLKALIAVSLTLWRSLKGLFPGIPGRPHCNSAWAVKKVVSAR